MPEFHVFVFLTGFIIFVVPALCLLGLWFLIYKWTRSDRQVQIDRLQAAIRKPWGRPTNGEALRDAVNRHLDSKLDCKPGPDLTWKPEPQDESTFKNQYLCNAPDPSQDLKGWEKTAEALKEIDKGASDPNADCLCRLRGYCAYHGILWSKTSHKGRKVVKGQSPLRSG